MYYINRTGIILDIVRGGSMKSMLILKNIVKKFGDRVVLKNVNAEFEGGINFILGPSGSGKSTFLKIIGGMDKEFDGEVIYKENSVKTFKEDKLNDYHYNSIGFIWQNFQLLNHLTVEENVRVVLELSSLTNEEKNKQVKEILYELGINNLANHKVAKISGGQKQRVAIARALVKNPEIIIADEPTGSLDKQSTKIIMEVLRKIAKDKLVIVVTHDKSLIDNEENFFYLKDGVLEKVQEGKNTKCNTVKKQKSKPHLSLSNAISQGIRNFKGFAFKFVLTSTILAVSTYLVALNIGGSVVENQKKIMTNFGEEVSDNVLRSISLWSTSDKNSEKSNKKVLEVGDKYKNDPRLEYLGYNVGIFECNIDCEGENIIKNKKYDRHTAKPDLNMDLLTGRMPKSGKKEVLIPKCIPNAENLIGKTISIKKGKTLKKPATKNSDMVTMDVEIEDVEVVGVINNSSQHMFIFNQDAESEFFEKYKVWVRYFDMGIKDKMDVLTIVNEINNEIDGYPEMECTGIFDYLEDISVLEGKTKEQSNSVLTIISILALAVTLIITILNAYLRKSEYAIFKINGYSKTGLIKLSIGEYGIISIIAIPIVIVGSLVMGMKNIPLSIFILLLQGAIMGIISGIISAKTNVVANLKTGEQK